MKVQLYDLDETLVYSHDIHLLSHITAFREVFGLDLDRDAVAPHLGKDISVFVRDICSENGRAQVSDKQVAKHIGYWEREAISRAQGGEVHLAAGVPDCLVGEEVIRAIVTCSTERIAREFLAQTGLAHYFSIIVGGEIGRTKTDLLRTALDRALDTGHYINSVLVVGDGIGEMEGGRAIDAYCGGITNGKYNGQKLTTAGAHRVIHSLGEYHHIPEIFR